MAKRWYSVSVLSNFEKKIAEQIKTAVSEASLESEIEEVLVPLKKLLRLGEVKKLRLKEDLCLVMCWFEWRCLTKGIT